MKLTSNQEVQLYNIAKGIALKQYYKYKYYGIDAEDMASDLYIKGVELVNKIGRFEPNLIAKSLYNDVVDIIRFNQRRVHMDVDPSQFEYNPELGVKSDLLSDTELNRNPISRNTTELVDVDDVMDSLILDPESLKTEVIDDLKKSKNKEYWYVWLLYKMEVEGDKEVIDKVVNLPTNEWLKNNKMDKFPVEGFISRALGYAGVHSTGFQNIKRSAKDILQLEGY